MERKRPFGGAWLTFLMAGAIVAAGAAAMLRVLEDARPAPPPAVEIPELLRPLAPPRRLVKPPPGSPGRRAVNPGSGSVRFLRGERGYVAILDPEQEAAYSGRDAEAAPVAAPSASSSRPRAPARRGAAGKRPARRAR